MKKTLFLFAAVMALGMVSCNKNTSTPMVEGAGAYYPNGNYIRSMDGTKYTLTAGSISIENPNLNRYFIRYIGTIPEGISSFGPEITIPITELINGTILPPTYLPNGGGAFDDPFAQMARFDIGTAVETGLNFLLVSPEFFLFTKNSPDKNDFAQVDFDLEIDDQIEPGPQNDTINMRLKFFNNRAVDEKPSYIPNAQNYTVVSLVPFDLEEEIPYFDITDGAGNNKTYIIKLTYRSYEWNETMGTDLDALPVYTKFMTCKWTPGDPYGQNRQ